MKSPSLKAKLMFLLIGIIAVSNGILGLLAYSMAKPALGRAVEQTITGVSADIATQIGKASEREFHLLDAIANLSTIRDPDIAGVAKTDSNYENIVFYDEHGNSVASTGQIVNMAEREYFRRAMAGEKCVVDPLFSPVTKSLLMFYSVPVRDRSNRIIGALVAIFHGDTLSKLCAGITIGEASHPFVINMRTGKTVADADVSFVEKGQILKDTATGEMREAIIDAMAGNTAYRTFFESWRQKIMVASYRPVNDGSGWAVFCMAPYDDFFGAIGRMALSMGVVVAVVLVIAVFVSMLVISMNLKPLKAVEASVTEIAGWNADLTKRIALSSHDEIGNVVSGFNKFTEKLQGIITSLKNSNSNLGAVGADMSASVEDTAGSISEIIENIDSMRRQIDGQSRSVDQTAGAVNEIASNIASLEQMIEGQSAGVTEASAAVEQMIGNISSVNQSVDKMALSFNALRSDSQTGISKQKSVNDRITQIESQSKMLQEANVAISTIASQTNLLAMNAAIEAAHAGDAGKGFAVVADEIRKLSETSTVQSKTIGVQLKNIRNSISEVVSASNESSVAFESVTRKLAETDALVMQIKAAMEEQNAGSKQIIDALHSMNDSTVEVRNASQGMADGSRVILGEMEQLKNAATAMTQGMEGMSVGARKISETGSALNGIAGKMNESIAQIGEQIDQFKV